MDLGTVVVLGGTRLDLAVVADDLKAEIRDAGIQLHLILVAAVTHDVRRA